MRLPKQTAPRLKPTIAPPNHSVADMLPQGTVENRSSQPIWITAGNQKHCLKSNETSNAVGISDADGLLLDGRPVLFDSIRIDLGGGQTNTAGAIKVCTAGTLTVTDAPSVNPALIAEISAAGFICPMESAGYKSPAWCAAHPGWDINTAPLGRPCS